MSEKRCYTVQELQEILGVSRPTIYNLLKKKEFRWIQLDGGKYRISAVADEVDPELLAKVLVNPEMRALLNSLAKTMK